MPTVYENERIFMTISDESEEYLIDEIKAQVDTKTIFISNLQYLDELTNLNFTEFLNICEIKAKREGTKITSTKITQQALGNARGKWFEWLIVLGFWRWALDNSNIKFTLAQLPNVTSFDSAKLFKPKIQKAIRKFKEVLLESDVTMVTSNPDFVILRRSPYEDALFENLQDLSITKATLERISEHYLKFVDSGNLNDIFGYLAVKSSMRPDRRLQIAHEGSTYKALSKNISKSLEIEEYIPYFFAVTSKTNDKDRLALKTVATHSIAENTSKPIRAVDQVFDVNSYQDLCTTFDELSRIF